MAIKKKWGVPLVHAQPFLGEGILRVTHFPPPCFHLTQVNCMPQKTP
jgi:hypothetical protein